MSRAGPIGSTLRSRHTGHLKNLNQDQSYRSVKIEKSRRVVESRLVCMDLKSGIKSRISRIIQEFMGLRSKRRNSPYIFQVVASPQTKAYIIVQVLVYKICAADLYVLFKTRVGVFYQI